MYYNLRMLVRNFAKNKVKKVAKFLLGSLTLWIQKLILLSILWLKTLSFNLKMAFGSLMLKTPSLLVPTSTFTLLMRIKVYK